MHIAVNMRPKFCINNRLIFSSKFVTFWMLGKGGGYRRNTIKCDMGEGR